MSDLGKVERELGWKPRIDPEGGIDELVSWVTSNREMFAAAY